MFKASNGLKHFANVPGFFYPLVSIQELKHELKNSDITTAYLNLHPLVTDESYLKIADEKSAIICLKDLSICRPSKSEYNNNIKRKLKLSEGLTLIDSDPDEFQYHYLNQPYIDDVGIFTKIMRTYQKREWYKIELSDKQKSFACFGMGDICIEYLLGASTENARFLQARLLHEGFNLYYERGYQIINLGGGIQNNDGLELFKSSLGTLSIKKRIIKLIIDEEKYNKNISGLDNGRFPEYI